MGVRICKVIFTKGCTIEDSDNVNSKKLTSLWNRSCSEYFLLFSETLSQKFSICAAVAAAAGPFRAAELGMAARGPPPRRRRPHTLKIFEILNFVGSQNLGQNWPERTQNGLRMDSERIPNGAPSDPEWTLGRQNSIRYTITHLQYRILSESRLLLQVIGMHP